MAAKKLLECCSNEEEIVKALISIRLYEETNISGLKRVRRNRCLDASNSFFRFFFFFLSKKKNLFLTSLIWKIQQFTDTFKLKLKHVDNRNELKNNKAILSRCLDFVLSYWKSRRAIRSFAATMVRQ